MLREAADRGPAGRTRVRDAMSVRRRQSVPLTAPFLAASSGAYAAVWFGSMGGIGNVGFGRIFFCG